MRCRAVLHVRTARGAQTFDASLSLLVERNTAESFVAESVVPGVEVHADPDVTWVVHPGNVWRNAAVLIRISESHAASRLDTMIARYRRHGRGMGLWLSPDARPTDLPALLRARHFRCRKHFPAMVRTLSQPVERLKVPSTLVVQQVRDLKSFETTPHPAVGPPTTELRRQALGRLRALVSASAPRMVPFVAYLEGRPVWFKRVVTRQTEECRIDWAIRPGVAIRWGRHPISHMDSSVHESSVRRRKTANTLDAYALASNPADQR